MADLDGDQDIDLATIASGSDRLSIFKNDGTGTFAVFQDIVGEGRVADLALEMSIEMVTRIWSYPKQTLIDNSSISTMEMGVSTCTRMARTQHTPP